MEKENWVLKFRIQVIGESSFGETVDVDNEVQFPLFATDAQDAETKAKAAIATITQAFDAEDKGFLKIYCGAIDDEDGVSVSDFRICFEKALDVPELSIVAGP